MTLDHLMHRLEVLRARHGGKKRVVVVDGYVPHRIEQAQYYQEGVYFDTDKQKLIEEPCIVLRSAAARDEPLPEEIRK